MRLWTGFPISGESATSRKTAPNTARAASCAQSCNSVGLMAELWFLAAASARAIARSRSAGSPMCVSRLQNIPDNWLWPGRSDLSCTDTGTIATSDLAGSSP